jgi:hypothetical protein
MSDKATPRPWEIASDASREAFYDWWVENSPTDHSHHVVHGTKSSIAALRVRVNSHDDLLEALRWLVNACCDVSKSGEPLTMNEYIDAVESGKEGHSQGGRQVSGAL